MRERDGIEGCLLHQCLPFMKEQSTWFYWWASVSIEPIEDEQ